ncbi:unnamed protein product [Rotaria sp. Silwood1]|nr:unnamed protein product [Rotaria sp. Silwood1]
MKYIIDLKKEVDGFVPNRLQYAIFTTALQLVHDRVAEPEDIDRAMTHRLAYFDLYGSTMQRVLTDRNFLSDWTQETIEKVDNYFRS